MSEVWLLRCLGAVVLAIWRWFADEGSGEGKAEQIGGDEPPPRFSARHRAAIQEYFVRSTVPVGGGRSPLAWPHQEAN